MVLAAEGPFFGCVTDFDHKIYQVLNRKHVVVKDRILRVDRLYKGPELVDQLDIVSVHPEIRSEHQIQEKFLTQSGIIDQEAQLGE